MARRIAILALFAVGVVACGGPSAASTGSPVATSAAPGSAASVIRVVDGDTLKARIAGRTETVRVIGVDSPESVKPDTPVECFALRASDEARRLLPTGGAILLEPDPTQATRDRYGRLLAHVLLADGTLYAERMIRGGFGIHDIHGGVPSIHAGPLAAAEVAARTAQRGLWSPATCAGNDHTAAPDPMPTAFETRRRPSHEALLRCAVSLPAGREGRNV